MDEPRPIGQALPEAIRAAFREGAEIRYRRVVDLLGGACPGYGADWLCDQVAGEVAHGDLSEADVAQAVRRFQKRIAQGERGELRPVIDKASYLSVVLSDLRSRHGLSASAKSNRRQASA